MKPLLYIITGVIVIAAAYYLISPFFVDRTVDEDFGLLLSDGRLDMGKVMAMPEEERLEMREEIMDAASSQPDASADEEMPSAAPELIASGTFVDADAVHQGSGRALLYRLPDGRHVVRFEDFRTTNGPDLVVYLARNPAPMSADDVTADGFVSLGKLKGNIGNQNYVIPPDVDVGEYRSVVIWCELFGVLFSPAALQPD